MSRKFLTNIDLNSNELRNGVIHNLATDPGTGVAGQLYFNTVDQTLKVYNGTTSQWEAVGSVEFIGDAVNDLLDSGTGISLNYNDGANSLTIANTGVTSIAGTANEVSVSGSAGAVTVSLPSSITVDVTGALTGNASTASTLQTPRSIGLGGSLSGSVSFDGSQNVTITADIVADSVALGTDTTGNYMLNVSAGTGVSVSHTQSEGSTATVSIGQAIGTTDNVTFNNVTISGTLTSDDITSTNISVAGNATITGNLTVSGTTTTINSTTIAIADLNLELARNATTAAQANGAGVTVTGPTTAATITYSSADDRWNLNKNLNVTTVYGALSGNASTASANVTALSIPPLIPITSDFNPLFCK